MENGEPSAKNPRLEVDGFEIVEPDQEQNLPQNAPQPLVDNFGFMNDQWVPMGQYVRDNWQNLRNENGAPPQPVYAPIEDQEFGDLWNPGNEAPDSLEMLEMPMGQGLAGEQWDHGNELHDELRMDQLADHGIGEPLLLEDGDQQGFQQNRDVMQELFDGESGGIENNYQNGAVQNAHLANQQFHNLPNEQYNNQVNGGINGEIQVVQPHQVQMEIDEEDPRHWNYQDAILLTSHPGQQNLQRGLEIIKLNVRDAITMGRAVYSNDQILNLWLNNIATRLMKRDRLNEIKFYSVFFWRKLTILRSEEEPYCKRRSYTNRLDSSGTNFLSMGSNQQDQHVRDEELKDEPQIRENIRLMLKPRRQKSRNDNIFSYKFLVIPLLEESHWMLAIVVNPGGCIVGPTTKASDDKCIILFFDSVSTWRQLRFNRCNYLLTMYLSDCFRLTQQTSSLSFDVNRIEWKAPKNLPLQTNEYECGFYVLNFVEGFFTHIIHSRQTVPIEKIRNLDWKEWYPEGEKMAVLMRDKVFNFIERDGDPAAFDRLSRHDRHFGTSGISQDLPAFRRSRRHSAQAVNRREKIARRNNSFDLSSLRRFEKFPCIRTL